MLHLCGRQSDEIRHSELRNGRMAESLRFLVIEEVSADCLGTGMSRRSMKLLVL